jgi:hypothetical protein
MKNNSGDAKIGDWTQKNSEELCIEVKTTDELVHQGQEQLEIERAQPILDQK